jgi:hypothetical protein
MEISVLRGFLESSPGTAEQKAQRLLSAPTRSDQDGHTQLRRAHDMPVGLLGQPELRARRGRNRHPSCLGRPCGPIVLHVSKGVEQGIRATLMFRFIFRPTALLRLFHGSMDPWKIIPQYAIHANR